MRKERTAKLHQRSKVLAEWEWFRWMAEKAPPQLIAVELELPLVV